MQVLLAIGWVTIQLSLIIHAYMSSTWACNLWIHELGILWCMGGGAIDSCHTVHPASSAHTKLRMCEVSSVERLECFVECANILLLSKDRIFKFLQSSPVLGIRWNVNLGDAYYERIVVIFLFVISNFPGMWFYHLLFTVTNAYFLCQVMHALSWPCCRSTTCPQITLWLPQCTSSQDSWMPLMVMLQEYWTKVCFCFVEHSIFPVLGF